MTESFVLYRNPSPVPEAERAQILAEPVFGERFTDHMARVTWCDGEGWGNRRLEPYGPLSLDPAAAVLHYGQEVFEGLKAYRHADGSVWLFRAQANGRRFAASARRLALPELPLETFLASIEALVTVDEAWVPGGEGCSLYLRPFMIATEPFLGVRPAREVEYLLIASPVGSYFATDTGAVSIWVAQDYHRAGPGGTGAAKCGGNYAASLLPQVEAYAQGCQQVCFLDARENRFLEELGGMNVYVVHADGSVATPALTGTILEGVTRDSIIALLRADGREVREEAIAFDELLTQLNTGEVSEVFACGTAAVVTPIGELRGEGIAARVGDGGAGAVTRDIMTRLTDIQFGRAPDPHGWMTRIV